VDEKYFIKKGSKISICIKRDIKNKGEKICKKKRLIKVCLINTFKILSFYVLSLEKLRNFYKLFDQHKKVDSLK